MQKDLTENELRALFRIIDRQSDISMTDEKGSIIYVNDNFVKTSKYSAEELVGQNHRMLKSGHQPQALFNELWKTISSGGVWRGDVKNRAKDGTYYWSDSIIAPILGSNNKPEKYIAVKFLISDKKQAEDSLKNTIDVLSRSKVATLNLLEDLTEEKRSVEKKVVERTQDLAESAKLLEESKEKVEILIESIGDGVIAIDTAGKITLWNKSAEKLTGWKLDEVMGKDYRQFLKLIKEVDRIDVSGPFIDSVMRDNGNKTLENHVLLIQKDGTELPVSDSAAPVRNNRGENVGVVLVLRDSSVERALNRSKDEFVSIASHQLRTPLTTIKGYTGMLVDGDAGPINDKQKEYLDEMKHANNRMIELINSLLNVSRIDLGVFSIEPKPINILDIARDQIKEVELNIKEKNQKLVVDFADDLPIINLDKKISEIIIQNLLSNAVKYTPVGGEITIHVAKDSTDLIISVKDTGYGIPLESQAKIFTKMYRADNARKKDPDGTGLGLYIVKAVLEQIGGKIWFESEADKGSTFYVKIPLSGMKPKEGIKGLQ